MTFRGLPLLLCAACAPPPEEAGPPARSCDGGETRALVMNELTFGRQDPPGFGVGFDLDGRVSEAGDSAGCNKPDLVGPDGTVGIDSAFSALVPVLEATEAAAVEGLIHDSIRSGELLLVLEVTGIDDPVDDDCVSLQVVRGAGTPLLATDGNLLDSQTFARSAEIAPGTTTSASISGGVLHADGLQMQLQLQVLDEFLVFDVMNGQVSAVFADDGTATGVFAGGLSVAQILYEFDIDDIDIVDLIQAAVPAAADLWNPENGECDGISITFEYEGIPAYLF